MAAGSDLIYSEVGGKVSPADRRKAPAQGRRNSAGNTNICGAATRDPPHPPPPPSILEEAETIPKMPNTMIVSPD